MTDEIQQDELTALKNRAEQMGLSFHPSIGVDKLRDKVNAKIQGEEEEATEAPVEASAEAENEQAFRLRKRQEASQLVRIQVTSMNPNKSEWEGEMFTAGNSLVGTYKHFVPFNVEWHVPRIIFNQIRDRQCQVFATKRVDGKTVREGKLIKEFNVAELEPLTEAELKDLGRRQSMASGTAS